jgi:hypothetical protein
LVMLRGPDSIQADSRKLKEVLVRRTHNQIEAHR